MRAPPVSARELLVRCGPLPAEFQVGGPAPDPEMMHGLDDSRAGVARGQITARCFHGELHLVARVPRTANHSRETPVQHRQIIVMIPGGQNVLGLHAKMAGHFPERAAFAVIVVAKADVNRVPLEIEKRETVAEFRQKCAEPIHIRIGPRYGTDKAAAVINGFRALDPLEKEQHLGEERSRQAKELHVIGLRLLVPVAERLPSAAPCAAVNVALLDDRVVRLDRKTELPAQAILEMRQRTPGIHRPMHALLAQILQREEQLRHDRRLRLVIDQGSIKVGAEQSDHVSKLAVEARTIRRLSILQPRVFIASGVTFHSEPASLNQNMKSAYELAMERLQKQSPTQQLTEDQKAQVAELDTVYKAKKAEREVFLRGEINKAQSKGELVEADELSQQLARDLRRLDEELEAKKEKLRNSR
jgi:hypothetical protein